MRWEQQQEHPNRPVRWVTWFEAVAFCRWLTERLQAAGSQGRVWYGGQHSDLRLPVPGFRCRLPTEAEWERAARGERGRRYAWGDKAWEPQRANLAGTVGDVAPVGMFPLGATPSGLLDMTGNVWEWTASLYRSYPYRGDDGRNDEEAEGPRVVRGACWDYFQGGARCAYRAWNDPDDYYLTIGFRVVMSLASSDS